jgi:deferrochelatase/peroxidase EfeB
LLDLNARSDPEQRTRLGEWLVGRKMSGEPLEANLATSIPGVGPDESDIRLNGFTYDADTDGARCPLGAHVRRANPRNADRALANGSDGPASALLQTLGLNARGVRDDLLSSVRFHRIIRRGREFGPRLLPQEAIRPPPPDDPERGLNFICLNANIARQFEFIQNAWILNTKFNGLDGEGDPLLGSREHVNGCPIADAYSLTSKNGIRPRLTGLPRFITVRGGAYFFLPGLRALRFLASSPAGADH